MKKPQMGKSSAAARMTKAQAMSHARAMNHNQVPIKHTPIMGKSTTIGAVKKVSR
jgi:hypothetical protein